MKLTITVNRKCGAPNYGSDGAGAELVLEVPDDDPAALQQIGGAWYQHLERLVDGQVAHMQQSHQGGGAVASAAQAQAAPPQQHAYVPPLPPAMPGPVAGGAPAGYQAPPIAPAPAPSGPPAGGDGGQRNDAPRTGKQLLGWANKVNKYDMLMQMAKSWNRGKVVEWTADDVAHAYQHLSRPAPQAWNGG